LAPFSLGRPTGGARRQGCSPLLVGWRCASGGSLLPWTSLACAKIVRSR
jgi:hypothetical protein